MDATALMNPYPTMRDVARAAGVSHVTVSLGLRDSSRISEERRVQIRDIADRLGYKPNPISAAWQAYRRERIRHSIHGSIAWLNGCSTCKSPSRLRELEVCQSGAAKIAAAAGYRLDEFAFDPRDRSASRLQNVLNARNIQGVLLAPGPFGHPLARDSMDWQKFSVVAIGESSFRLPVHQVAANRAHATTIAFSNLEKRGYRRIGFVCEESGPISIDEAWFANSSRCGPPESKLEAPVFRCQDGHTRHAADRMKEWIREARVDAIITDVANIREIFAAARIDVPRDVGVASLSITRTNGDAGIDVHAEEIGGTAAELLLSMMFRNVRGTPSIRKTTLIDGHWHNGNTLASPTHVMHFS